MLSRRPALTARLVLLSLAPLFIAAGSRGGAGIAEGPYLMFATTRSMTVCWVSNQPETGSVRCTLEAQDFHARWATVTESAGTRYHRVRITGLRPYTRYAYTVTCGGATSEPATFRTAAPPRQPFHFVAYGDTRTQPERHAAVVRRIMTFRPDFVIQTGDQVADGRNESQWEVFFTTAEPMLKNAPYYPVLGNHEREAAPYFHYFDLPRDYSFDYGNTHFVALDSNRPQAELAAQDEWLRHDLAAHQDATWRIVFFHHTPYTCVAKAARRAAAVKLRARLEPIFQAGKVQLVLNGHDHTYQHHIGASGIHYVVTGGGGAPLYDVRLDTPFTVTARKAYNDCEISVNGPALLLRAVEPDGTVIDRFVLHAAT